MGEIEKISPIFCFFNFFFISLQYNSNNFYYDYARNKGKKFKIIFWKIV